MNELQLKGDWHKIKGKAKEIYGEITDDKLKEYEGKGQQLIGYLQEKTGKTKEEIVKMFNDGDDSRDETPQNTEVNRKD